MRVRWLEQADLSAAVAAGDRIQACVDLLESFPHLGHEGAIPGTREFTVRGSKSVIVHRIVEDAVVILRVFHGGQDRSVHL